MGGIFTEYVRSLQSQHTRLVWLTRRSKTHLLKGCGELSSTWPGFFCTQLTCPWYGMCLLIAVKLVAYLRIIHLRAKTGISTLESYSGATPDLRHLHAFGCSVEAYLGQERQYAADKKRYLSLGKKLVDQRVSQNPLPRGQEEARGLIFLRRPADVKGLPSRPPEVPAYK